MDTNDNQPEEYEEELEQNNQVTETVDAKKKKKKNKNKKKKTQEVNEQTTQISSGKQQQQVNQVFNPKGALNDVAASTEDFLMNSLSKILGDFQQGPPNFENFDKCVEEIHSNIQSINQIIDDVKHEKFENIPDEKEEESREQKATDQSQLDPKMKERINKVLVDLNDKCDYFEDRKNKLNEYLPKVSDSERLTSIIKNVMANLDDDIARNKEIYKLIQIS